MGVRVSTTRRVVKRTELRFFKASLKWNAIWRSKVVNFASPHVNLLLSLEALPVWKPDFATIRPL